MECVVGVSDLMTEPGGVYHVQNIYRLLERGRESEGDGGRERKRVREGGRGEGAREGGRERRINHQLHSS